MANSSLIDQLLQNIADRRNRQAAELRQPGFTELFFTPQVRQKDLLVGLPDPGVIEPCTLHTLNSLNYIA